VRDPSSSRSVVRFGQFELDQHSGELRRDGTRIRLQEQPLQVLQILLENPGKIIPREELQKRIWPSDTFVDFDHGINNAIKRLREALGDTAETPRFIETVPRRGYRFIAVVEVPSRSVHTKIESIAVLPLENLSRDPEQEYFADGLTEALITSLAKIGGLRVVSRTTAMHYKGVHRPVREIAREVEADAVVEGSVLRSGERLRISVQLIDARKDSHLWAESYERDLQNILSLHSEIARAVATEIQIKLTPKDQQQLTAGQTGNTRAYEAYLKARFYWNKFTPEGVSKAVEYFQQAVAIDPSYSVAYSGLADCSSRMGWWGFASPECGFGAGRAAAQKAVELAPALAEAHGSLAWAIMHYDWDLVTAEQEFRRALELNSNYMSVQHFYAPCLAAMTRSDEYVMAEMKRVLRLDPLSLIANFTAAYILAHMHRFEESMEYSRKTLEVDPNFPPARLALALAFHGTGNYEQALAEVRKAMECSGNHGIYVSALGSIYAASGRRDDALKAVAELEALSKQRYVMPDWIAYIFACMNEKDEAFHWLDKAFDGRSPWLVYAARLFWLDNVRSDSRFDALLRRMNFPRGIQSAVDRTS
jgi:TolB-like protein/Flp pilus assembly protein TadD